MRLPLRRLFVAGWAETVVFVVAKPVSDAVDNFSHLIIGALITVTAAVTCAGLLLYLKKRKDNTRQ